MAQIKRRMKSLPHPLIGKLVRYYDRQERSKVGHLLETKGAKARVKPLGPYHSNPNAVWVDLDGLKEATQ